jgi:hypothetical protein
LLKKEVIAPLSILPFPFWLKKTLERRSAQINPCIQSAFFAPESWSQFLIKSIINSAICKLYLKFTLSCKFKAVYLGEAKPSRPALILSPVHFELKVASTNTNTITSKALYGRWANNSL